MAELQGRLCGRSPATKLAWWFLVAWLVWAVSWSGFTREVPQPLATSPSQVSGPAPRLGLQVRFGRDKKIRTRASAKAPLRRLLAACLKVRRTGVPYPGCFGANPIAPMRTKPAIHGGR
jgi:hypothetical protein